MKRGTHRHPKLLELVRVLKRRRPEVIGILDLLWSFTADFAPQGNIGKYSDDRIEAACDWNGPAGKLVESLVTTGWCDEHSDFRLVVHDWHEHCEDAVRRRLSRAKLPFLSISKTYVESDGNMSDGVRLAERKSSTVTRLPLPLPLPEPIPQPLPPSAPPDRQPPESELFAFFEQRCQNAGVVVEPNLWQSFGTCVRSAEEAEALRANLDGWLQHPRYAGGLVTARKLAAERAWLKPAITPNGRHKKSVWTELEEQYEREAAEEEKRKHAH